MFLNVSFFCLYDMTGLKRSDRTRRQLSWSNCMRVCVSFRITSRYNIIMASISVRVIFRSCDVMVSYMSEDGKLQCPNPRMCPISCNSVQYKHEEPPRRFFRRNIPVNGDMYACISPLFRKPRRFVA